MVDIFEKYLSELPAKIDYSRFYCILLKHCKRLSEKNKYVDMIYMYKRYLQNFPQCFVAQKITINSAIAHCYSLLKENDKSAEYFKIAAEIEQTTPSKQNTSLNYAEFVVKNSLTNYYYSAEDVLCRAEKSEDFILAYQRYKGYAMLAILLHKRDDIDNAKRYKLLAEQAARTKQSGSEKHSTIGVVKERDKMLDKLLKEI